MRNLYFDTREPAEVAHAIALQRRQQTRGSALGAVTSFFSSPSTAATTAAAAASVDGDADDADVASDDIDRGELDAQVDASLAAASDAPFAHASIHHTVTIASGTPNGDGGDGDTPASLHCQEAPDPLRELDGGAPQIARLIKGVWEHDHVVCAGGLNYRLDLNLTQIVPMLQRRDVRSLFAADDLNEQRASGAAFAELCEAPLGPCPRFLRFGITAVAAVGKPVYCIIVHFIDDSLSLSLLI